MQTSRNPEHHSQSPVGYPPSSYARPRQRLAYHSIDIPVVTKLGYLHRTGSVRAVLWRSCFTMSKRNGNRVEPGAVSYRSWNGCANRLKDLHLCPRGRPTGDLVLLVILPICGLTTRPQYQGVNPDHRASTSRCVKSPENPTKFRWASPEQHPPIVHLLSYFLSPPLQGQVFRAGGNQISHS